MEEVSPVMDFDGKTIVAFWSPSFALVPLVVWFAIDKHYFSHGFFLL
jgi:hypothetical protein